MSRPSTPAFIHRAGTAQPLPYDVAFVARSCHSGVAVRRIFFFVFLRSTFFRNGFVRRGVFGACQVFGADLCLPAIEDAKVNAEANGLKNCEFLCGKVGQFFLRVWCCHLSQFLWDTLLFYGFTRRKQPTRRAATGVLW